jgi:hypothetical protein
VEDGTAFCPQCNAPQIRVGASESLPPAGGEIPQQPTERPPLTIIVWPQAVRSSMVALVAVFFMILLGVPAGVGMLAAGFLSVVLYRRRCPLDQLSAGTGAWLGVLSGALGFGVLLVILGVTAAFRPGQIRSSILNVVQEYAARNPDPRMQQVLELFKTPEGFAVMMALGLAMTLVAFLIFSAAGGAIGAVLLRRKDRL